MYRPAFTERRGRCTVTSDKCFIGTPIKEGTSGVSATMMAAWLFVGRYGRGDLLIYIDPINMVVVVVIVVLNRWWQ
jgi:hypothetical protein